MLFNPNYKREKRRKKKQIVCLHRYAKMTFLRSSYVSMKAIHTEHGILQGETPQVTHKLEAMTSSYALLIICTYTYASAFCFAPIERSICVPPSPLPRILARSKIEDFHLSLYVRDGYQCVSTYKYRSRLIVREGDGQGGEGK